MWRWIILTLWVAEVLDGARPKCGGHLKSTRGIISTPNYPDAFPTPITCKWIIDAHSISRPGDNYSIVVYLNEVLLTEGLTFTELFDINYQEYGNLVYQLNETTAGRVRYIETFQSYLLVTLTLDTLIGNHIRVLDHFLDVYGFNITYEITRTGVRRDACNLDDCGYTGICVDHYTRFSCDCFEGFTGPSCSSGPKSFCFENDKNPCKNDGTCRHVGHWAIKCICSKEFAGQYCENPSNASDIAEKEHKREFPCEFDETEQNVCRCLSRNITEKRPDIEFTVENVTLNVDRAREGEEFILTCTAWGPPNATFRWYKDGTLIDPATGGGSKWSKDYPDPLRPNLHRALLAVERAHPVDKGRYTCQMRHERMQFCSYVDVNLIGKPLIRLKPLMLAVKKGQNFTVTCEGDVDNAYSWTKNRHLLPASGPTEKYEVLYTGGSVLQVSDINRTTAYACLLQDSAGTSVERNMIVLVIDRPELPMCPAEERSGLRWPKVPPDTVFRQFCPSGYTLKGHVSRSCVLKDGIRPVWSPPDFSQCTAKKLERIRLQMVKLRLGYQIGEPPSVLVNYLKYVQSHRLLNGEGGKVLDFVKDVVSYVKENRKVIGLRRVATLVASTVNAVMLQPDSLIDQQQIRLVQQVLKELCWLLTENGAEFQADLNFFHISTYLATNETNSSFNQDFRLYWKSENESVFISMIVYKNLSLFLPTKATYRRQVDQLEIEYEIASTIASVWYFSKKLPQLVFDLEHHPNVRSNFDLRCAMTEFATFEATWEPDNCRTLFQNRTATRCLCSSPKGGTFAVLQTAKIRHLNETKNENRTTTVEIVSCITLSIASLITSSVLAIAWASGKSCIIYLKLQSSLASLITSTVFGLCVYSVPDIFWFPLIFTVLEISILLSISAHLATLLFIYAEMERAELTTTTIVGMELGVPSLAVFANHLAHRTMAADVRSWWLLIDSLAFQVFVVSCGIVIALFSALYILLERRLGKVQKKKSFLLKKRLGLVRRSALIFYVINIAVTLSICYVNNFGNVWVRYGFAAGISSWGFLLVCCYVLLPEEKLFGSFKKEEKPKSSDQFFTIEATITTPNFFTTQDVETEVAETPQKKPITKSSKSFKLSQFSTSSDCCKIRAESKSLTTFTGEKHLPQYEATCRGVDLVVSSVHRTQPDGREISQDRLDGMLSSISHDLDILLNREVDVEMVPVPIGRQRSSMVSLNKSFPQIIEETEEELKT